MIVKGILCDPIGQAIPNGLIELMATHTGAQAFAKAQVCIKADENGRYEFELLPGAYRVYAQVSRCSDVILLGEAVVTVDSPDGNLNQLIGFSAPILPPQVELAQTAATEAIQAANAASDNLSTVIEQKNHIDDQAEQVNERAQQAQQSAQSASDNAANALQSLESALMAVESAQGFASESAQIKGQIDHIAQLIHDVYDNVSVLQVEATQAAKVAQAEAEISNDAARRALGHSQTAQQHSRDAKAHRDNAREIIAQGEEQLDQLTDTADSVLALEQKAGQHRAQALQHSDDAKRAKDSAKESQVNAQSAAAQALNAEAKMDMALPEMREIGELAQASIEQTANNAHGAQQASDDAALASQQAQTAQRNAKQSADTSQVNANQTATDTIEVKHWHDEAQFTAERVDQLAQQVTENTALSAHHANVAEQAVDVVKTLAKETFDHRNDAAESANDANLAATQAQQAAQLSDVAAQHSQEAVVTVAKNLIATQNVIVSLHTI